MVVLKTFAIIEQSKTWLVFAEFELNKGNELMCKKYWDLNYEPGVISFTPAQASWASSVLDSLTPSFWNNKTTLYLLR